MTCQNQTIDYEESRVVQDEDQEVTHAKASFHQKWGIERECEILYLIFKLTRPMLTHARTHTSDVNTRTHTKHPHALNQPYALVDSGLVEFLQPTLLRFWCVNTVFVLT